MAAAAAMLFTAVSADAQMGKKYYINGGWQFNATPDNDFVTSAQGYGAYIGGGYYVAPMLAVGGFASFNTNNEYVPKRTYVFADKSALTTDLNRSIYQVPFGATLRWRMTRKIVQPYMEAKIGAEYSTQSTYMSTFVSRYSNWGFYVSPEIGMTLYPFYRADFGFQLAVYYSYATNRNDSIDMNGLNNVGFKLGIAF